jgi:iron complex outermembrane receptor protein
VRSSELLAYTAGYKTRLFGDTLQVNTELFYYDYSDLAIQSYDIAAPFNPVFNAEKVEVYGTQIDAVCAVASHARINLNIGYTRARNEEFITPAGDDYSGLQPPYAPDWTVLAGYEQGFSAGSGALVARVDGRWESSWFADYVHNPGVKQASSWKADASLTYESRGTWTVGAWIKNISDEPVIAATAAAGIPGPATAYLERPRTYGVRATLEF